MNIRNVQEQALSKKERSMTKVYQLIMVLTIDINQRSILYRFKLFKAPPVLCVTIRDTPVL